MRIIGKIGLALLLCFGGSTALAQDDKVRIKGIEAGEEVLLVASARKASGQGCLDEQDQDKWRVYRTDAAGNVNLEKNLQRGCALTVAAFSKKRAMLLKTLSGWKDQGGETKTVTMTPPVNVPVVIWITDNALENIAYRQVAKAAELYRENMVGFNFVPTFRNVSGDSVTVDLIKGAVTPHPSGVGSVCSGVESLKARNRAYKAKTLNVYYVNREGLHRNCAIRETPSCDGDLSQAPKADGNVTYLGADSQEILSVYAHELGHAFGLRPICQGGHPIPATPGFGTTNIMIGAGGDQRDKFTLGQIFRMNTQKDEWGGTMIIANKLRPGPGRECRLAGQEHYTYKCPPLNLTFDTQ